MNRLSKVSLSLSVLFMFALIAGTFSAGAVESQNVVGFFKVDVAGNAYSLISVPMQKMTVYSGTITSQPATNQISDSSANWTSEQYKMGTITTNGSGSFTEPGASTFYVEISGPTNAGYYGRHYYITNNSANTLTLLGSDLGTTNVLGASYKIVPAHRIRDFLGEGAGVKIQGGGSTATADSILLWTGAGWSTYYYDPSFPLGARWLNPNTIPTDEGNTVIDRDVGFFINRLSNSTNIVATGEVSANSRGVVLSGSGTYDLVKFESVVNRSLDASGLKDQLVGGGSTATADSILLWTGAGWSTYYYDPTFPLGARWLNPSTIPTDEGGTMLEAGKSYFVSRVAAGTATITDVSPLE